MSIRTRPSPLEALDKHLGTIRRLEATAAMTGPHLRPDEAERLREALAALRSAGRLTHEHKHLAARLLDVDVRTVGRDISLPAETHATAEERDAIIATLRRLQVGGRLTGALKRAAAEQLECSVRTIERDLGRGGAPTRTPRRFELTEHHRELLIEAHGRADRLHELMLDEAAEPTDVPCLRTVQRAVKRLGPHERAYAKGGAKARRGRDIYVRNESSYANEQWQMDSVLLPVEVLAPGHTKPVRAIATLVEESKHREWIGTTVSVVGVTTADVLATLGAAVLNSGMPDALRLDNALEFRSKAVARAMTAVGCVVDLCDPYAPHQKGKVERLIKTIEETLCPRLPGYLSPARTVSDKRYASVTPMTIERFVEALEDFRLEYNATAHRALGGLSPTESRAADPTVAKMLEPAQVRYLFQDAEQRTIQKDGIHFRSVTFVAAELNGLVGERVEVRFRPHDRRWINVYADGRFLCTAYPQDMLSDEEQQAVIERRREDAAELRARRDKARRRARVRLAPLTPGESVVITNTATTREANAEEPERPSAKRRRLSRRAIDLLGLGDSQ
jgi:putative transposase